MQPSMANFIKLNYPAKTGLITFANSVPVYSNHPQTLYFIDNVLTDCGFIKKEDDEYFTKTRQILHNFLYKFP